jgi:hypothetical protein
MAICKPATVRADRAVHQQGYDEIGAPGHAARLEKELAS